MVILTHGSDLTLAPTIAPVVHQGDGTVRTAMARLARQGFPAVQLDATLRGIRPRELDRNARRELAGVARRRGLSVAGLDLFVPRKHYLDPERVDRALSATLGAIELAADLGRVPVSLTLPAVKLAEDQPELIETIVEMADGRGVGLAIHAEEQLESLQRWLDDIDVPSVGAGLDPAPLLARGHDPAVLAQRLGRRLTVGRLSDLERGAGHDDATVGETVRCVPGRGELDLTAYRVALDLASSRTGPVVLDLRGLTDPLTAANAGQRAWDDAAVSF